MMSRPASERRQSLRYEVILPITLASGEGTTHNLNLSGVYFETDAALQPGRPVDFSICVSDGASIGAHLYCYGCVLRVEEQGEVRRIAASIDSFWFERIAQLSDCERCREGANAAEGAIDSPIEQEIRTWASDSE
ncbi:MAG: PilZ domain-containing protein [Acidobacteriota bacterium]